MTQNALLAAARELTAIHGILPVAASGKRPMGGRGWNSQPLAARLQLLTTPECTGLGMQCGLVFHPVLGPVDSRILDSDEKDPAKRDAFQQMFMYLLGDNAKRITWRWGRGPACVLFTRGEHHREKYGSIQLLGQGKYAVGWGWHPEVGQYRWPAGDVFSVMPPLLDVKMVEACILAAGRHAGIPMDEKSMLSLTAPEITEAQISMLSAGDLARYREEVAAELARIEAMPEKTGRGTALNRLGLRYGAIARHDAELDGIFQDALARLPGDMGHGDVRDLSRGLDGSKGLAQKQQALWNEQRNAIVASLKPKGAALSGIDLMQEDIPPLRWLVDRFLPQGTVLLIGKPKIGKSYIALEMALSICEGGKFWDEQCHQTGVLLYMLEDGKRRIKQRLKQLRPEGPKFNSTFRIRFATEGPFQVNPDGSGGLLDDIRAHKRDFPDIELVIIDMLKVIRGSVDTRQNDYNAENSLTLPISKLANELEISIFIIHHAKKGEINVDNYEDALSGSNALSGMADSIWFLWRKGDIAYMFAKLRDAEDVEIQLQRKEGELVWNPIEKSEYNTGSMKERVRNVLMAANCELTPRDVAMRLNIDDRIANARLHDLRKEGQIQNPRHSIYCMPGAQSRPEAILSAIMQHGIVVPVTSKLRELHDPEGKWSHLGDADATGFAFLDDVTGVIERAKFADGKHALTTLVVHRLIVERKGVVWFFGPAVNRTLQPLPWAIQYPWSVAR